MDEELNDQDLEERLYSLIHHVDQTQINVNQTPDPPDATPVFENNHRSTLLRYWRNPASNPNVKINNNSNFRSNTVNQNLKLNTPNLKVSAPTNAKSNTYVRINPTIITPAVGNSNTNPDDPVPKEEKSSSPHAVDLSIFSSPLPENLKKTIEILEDDNNDRVILESSDEDEVVEVALPPKPTITIESSEDEEPEIVKLDLTKPTTINSERDISASPVASVISSVSDDFIRGDCIALNISSQADNPSFDFSLHGSDLIIQNTPTKKKKKKKNKSTATSTPVAVEKTIVQTEECFATPKGKAKNKKKTKSIAMAPKTIPNPDIYDSDSNQSIIDITKSKNTYTVTEKSLPSADVYESDSSQSEVIKEINTAPAVDTGSSDSNPELKDNSELFETCETVDLTGNDSFFTIDNTGITENIVLSNVTGFQESHDYAEQYHSTEDISKFVSSKIPPILNADLDFDNLKGNERVCKKRRYSVTSLRDEMEKFYNESWGGEDFNHREIQKNMSRDKDLWAIDIKDKLPANGQRKTKCNYCNRFGHRDETCMRKPAVCHMCGTHGHYETRCPAKICVNCGSRSNVYTNVCRHCATWRNIKCAECGQNGHPSSHCPDIWRRYHNTIDITPNLEKCVQTKNSNQLYCSGCSRRGHLIHTCRTTISFAAFAINSPYVCVYNPIYLPPVPKQFPNKAISQDNTISSATQQKQRKRQSHSPIPHDPKKRHISGGDDTRSTKSPINPQTVKPPGLDKNKEPVKNVSDSAKAPDLTGSSNRDNKGQMIQDNEVSDTSGVVTSARIYVTNELIDKIKPKDGEDWLQDTMNKLNITVQCCRGNNSYLSIRGKVADQETFQQMLRERENPEEILQAGAQQIVCEPGQNLPKVRNKLLLELTRALESLKKDWGDPQSIYKELNYQKDRHSKLLKQKMVNATALAHCRGRINSAHKRLNTVLLGQARLANGSFSISQLISHTEKLGNSNQQFIPQKLRKEIGKHFNIIFSSNPREDYSALVNLYYKSNAAAKKRKEIVPSPKINKISIPSLPDSPRIQNAIRNAQKLPVNVYMNKLKFYKWRLVNMKPKGSNQKKAISDLIRKLHTYIASMSQKETLTSKVLKKIKKAQQEAQGFLSADVFNK